MPTFRVCCIFFKLFPSVSPKTQPQSLCCFLLDGRPLVLPSLSSFHLLTAYRQLQPKKICNSAGTHPRERFGTASNHLFSSGFLLYFTNVLQGVFWFLWSCSSFWCNWSAWALGHFSALIFFTLISLTFLLNFPKLILGFLQFFPFRFCIVFGAVMRFLSAWLC